MNKQNKTKQKFCFHSLLINVSLNAYVKWDPLCDLSVVKLAFFYMQFHFLVPF